MVRPRMLVGMKRNAESYGLLRPKKCTCDEPTVCEIRRITPDIGYPMESVRRKGDKHVVFMINAGEDPVATVFRGPSPCIVDFKSAATKRVRHSVEVIEQRDSPSTVSRVSVRKTGMAVKAIHESPRDFRNRKGFDV